MRILGIDPASEKCGYGVIDVGPNGRETYVEAGVISAPANRDKYQRLAEIGRDLAGVIAETKPDVVAIEAGFIAHQQGALVSAAARGVCGYVAALAGLEVHEYAPATVKKAATGNGRAEKASVALLVQKRLGLARRPADDASDALAVALAHAQHAPAAKLQSH